METGDSFEYSDETQMYVSKHNEDFHRHHDGGDTMHSSYSSTFSISTDYAKELIKEGYLEEITDKPASDFINVFDEIDSLISKYDDELSNVDEDMATFPECVKVEKKTVLNNLITVLDHLKSLKK